MVDVRSFSPHLCVGFLFLVVHSRPRPPPPPPPASSRSTHTPLTNTQLTHTPLTTHHLLTHHLLTHHIPTFVTKTFTFRGRRGTYGTGLALVTRFPFADVVAAALCVAGVAVGDINLRFAWQAWYLVTSTVTLRGRRGTCGTGLALVTRLVPVCRRCRRGSLRGRRGTW